MSYRKIGKIIQSFGLNGQVVILQDVPSGKPLLKLDHLFIELQQGSYIPFFPDELPKLMDDDKSIWKLDDISSSEAAKEIVGKQVYIEEEKYLKLFPARSSLEADLTGFIIKDRNSSNSGVIESVIESPGQLLASVIFAGKEVLIPLVEHFLITIDAQKKVIEMKLPEGIWEL